jgi:hypothetical protein
MQQFGSDRRHSGLALGFVNPALLTQSGPRCGFQLVLGQSSGAIFITLIGGDSTSRAGAALQRGSQQAMQCRVETENPCLW